MTLQIVILDSIPLGGYDLFHSSAQNAEEWVMVFSGNGLCDKLSLIVSSPWRSYCSFHW